MTRLRVLLAEYHTVNITITTVEAHKRAMSKMQDGR
jgi:hypothetical protein